MNQLLLHLFGDFILQNDHVGIGKKEKSPIGLFRCVFHCITYSLPFLLITNWLGVILIGAGHFVIDRWQFTTWFIKTKNREIYSGNFGYSSSRPAFVALWLNIIQDQVLHLIINYLIIYMVN
jgi:hypothetical protein